MNFVDVEIPSNRKFGFFFTAVFCFGAAYLYLDNGFKGSYFLGAIGLVILGLTILNADALTPLNKLWMGFGLLLGRIVSPIVMGMIFFGMFTPIAILMRVFGRDELRLCFRKTPTYWVKRDARPEHESFENQF